MSGKVSALPAWVNKPPGAYDIVTAYFPETNPRPGETRLRPCLVTQVQQNRETESYACAVVFGTKQLKLTRRGHLDIIIQNHEDIIAFGLGMATRFDLDSPVRLPWSTQFFGCWSGRRSPVIGHLTIEYVRDYAFKMLKRGSVPEVS
jgi:hypothetical protein